MNYFENIDIFSDLSYEDGEKLSSFCQKKTLGDGELLFSQGDEAQAMYMVLSGKLGVYKDGEYLVSLGRGSLVGEMAFLGEEHRRNASVKSIGSTEIITIIDFSIQEIFRKYPSLFEKIKAIIEERK